MTVHDFLYIKKLLEDERDEMREHYKSLQEEAKKKGDASDIKIPFVDCLNALDEINKVYSRFCSAEVRV